MKAWMILPFVMLTACNKEESATFKILSQDVTILDANALSCAETSQDTLSFKLNEAASQTLADYTQSNIGNSLVLSICQSRGEPIVIQDKISSGHISYTLRTQAEKDCAKILEKQIGRCVETVTTDSAQTKTVNLKGHYTWGHEVNTFTPCHDQKTYWVTGSPVVLKKLEEQYKILTKTAYEKTYALISGQILPKDANSDGFDADYKGLISIDSVESISSSSQDDCK